MTSSRSGRSRNIKEVTARHALIARRRRPPMHAQLPSCPFQLCTHTHKEKKLHSVKFRLNMVAALSLSQNF